MQCKQYLSILISAVLFSCTVNPLQTNISDDQRSPEITVQPQSQSAHIGQGIVFKVKVSGSSPFIYQWYKDGVAILGVSDSYEINDVQPEDSGVYAVVVSNSHGTAQSDSAVLSLLPISPTILAIYPSNDSANIYIDTVPDADSYNLYYAIGDSVDQTTGIKISGGSYVYDFKGKPKVYKITIDSLQQSEKYAFAASAVNSAGESYLSSIKTYNSDDLFIVTVDSIGTIQAGQNKAISGKIQSYSTITSVSYTMVDSAYVQASGISRTVNNVTGKSSIDLRSDAALTLIVSSSAKSGKYYLVIKIQTEAGASEPKYFPFVVINGTT